VGGGVHARMTAAHLLVTGWNIPSRNKFYRHQKGRRIMKNVLVLTSVALCLGAGATSAQTTIITQPTTEATEVQTDQDTTGGGAVGGAATGAVAGAVVGGPVGAVVGGLAGAVTGDITEDAAVPPETRTYVMENRVEPVTIDNVAVGTAVPTSVQLQQIPDSEYQYVYVGEQPVIVEPQTRKIIYIVK